MFEKNEKRFVVKEEQLLGLGAVQTILDKVTGVNYINTIGASMSGITPLLDSSGKVVIDAVEEGNAD